MKLSTDFKKMNNNKKEISIVIPAYDEAENLSFLHKEITETMIGITDNYEIIVIDDGSNDNTEKVLEDIFNSDCKHIIGIHFKANFGKASALKAGFREAQGEIIITMDADLQDDPKEIPKFIAKINEGYDLVSGWKQNRKDSFIKNTSSRLFNCTTSLFSKVKLHDFNSGYKAYKSDAAKSIDLYGELHRYIPVIAHNQGYKISEIPIHHRKRKYGKSKYGPIRFLNGFLDLLTVMVLTKYFRRPAHFFGGLGTIALGIGFIIGLYITYLKLLYGNIQGRLPLFIAGILLIMVGIQLISLGLIGEMFVKISGKEDVSAKIKRIIKK